MIIMKRSHIRLRYVLSCILVISMMFSFTGCTFIEFLGQYEGSSAEKETGDSGSEQAKENPSSGSESASDSKSASKDNSSATNSTADSNSSKTVNSKVESSKNESSKKDSSKEDFDKSSTEDSSEKSKQESKEESSGNESSKEESQVETSTSTYKIRVNCSTNVITIYTKDSSGAYTIPVKAMICSTGPKTPQGEYIMGYQARWNGLIEDAYGREQWGQYVSHITGDFLFHTVPSVGDMSPSTVSVAEYNKLGTTCSHGCIRITAGDAYWMYCNCNAYECPIEIGFFGDGADPLGKPSSIQLPTSSELNWDPTDPSSENPWNYCSPYFEGVADELTLHVGDEVPDFTQGVSAYDTCGNYMYYYIVNQYVDTSEIGTYTVSYSCTDVLGRSGYAETTVHVVAADA